MEMPYKIQFDGIMLFLYSQTEKFVTFYIWTYLLEF